MCHYPCVPSTLVVMAYSGDWWTWLERWKGNRDDHLGVESTNYHYTVTWMWTRALSIFHLRSGGAFGHWLLERWTAASRFSPTQVNSPYKATLQCFLFLRSLASLRLRFPYNAFQFCKCRSDSSPQGYDKKGPLETRLSYPARFGSCQYLIGRDIPLLIQISIALARKLHRQKQHWKCKVSFYMWILQECSWLLFRIAGLEKDTKLHGNQFNIILAGMYILRYIPYNHS